MVHQLHSPVLNYQSTPRLLSVGGGGIKNNPRPPPKPRGREPLTPEATGSGSTSIPPAPPPVRRPGHGVVRLSAVPGYACQQLLERKGLQRGRLPARLWPLKQPG